MSKKLNLYTELKSELAAVNVKLIAISKTKPTADILELYQAGQRVFGENIVQELVDKYEELPKDIEWHLVGHLQSNKVKYIAPFISLIHGVDSLKLLQEINKQAAKQDRVIDCLLQVHIADEETKFGFDHAELIEMLQEGSWKELKHVRICGLMGIATNTKSQYTIKEEFYELATLLKGIKQLYFRKEASFKELSMGMSSDYKIAIEQGSTMVRIGSMLFGERSIKNA